MADSEDVEFLGIIDENSEGRISVNSSSSDVLNQNELPITLKEKNSEIVGYRLVQLPKDKPTTVANQNQQYFVIHDANLFVNNPRKIAPKPTETSTVQHVQIGPPPPKKRDDRRRATHNEVERRRRDKINQWIMKLGSLIPADGLSDGDRDRVNVINSAVESKGVILSKACEYISSMKSNYDDVNECLRASEELNNKLQSENQYLKELLDRNGIAYESDSDDKILS